MIVMITITFQQQKWYYNNNNKYNDSNHGNNNNNDNNIETHVILMKDQSQNTPIFGTNIPHLRSPTAVNQIGRFPHVLFNPHVNSKNPWKVPSGKHTKNYGKSPFFMGKSTISTGPFSIAVCWPEGNHQIPHYSHSHGNPITATSSIERLRGSSWGHLLGTCICLALYITWIHG